MNFSSAMEDVEMDTEKADERKFEERFFDDDQILDFL